MKFNEWRVIRFSARMPMAGIATLWLGLFGISVGMFWSAQAQGQTQTSAKSAVNATVNATVKPVAIPAANANAM